MSTNPLKRSMILNDEQEFYDEVDSELFKSQCPIKIQKKVLETMNVVRDSSSEDVCTFTHPTPEEKQSSEEENFEENYNEDSYEDLHEIEKNMQSIKESPKCFDTLIDLFILKVIIPIVLFFMHIPYYFIVYRKEFVSICLIFFGLIIIGIYVYYIARSVCSM